MTKEYAVVYEEGPNNWSAYSPDVPGCVATGKTFEATETLFRDALAFHLRGLAEDGDPIPEPHTRAGMVTIAA